MEVDVEEYVSSFCPDLMEVVGAWYRGARFKEIAGMTSIFEGSLVRAIRRLEEVRICWVGAFKKEGSGISKLLVALYFRYLLRFQIGSIMAYPP